MDKAGTNAVFYVFIIINIIAFCGKHKLTQYANETLTCSTYVPAWEATRIGQPEEAV